MSTSRIFHSFHLETLSNDLIVNVESSLLWLLNTVGADVCFEYNEGNHFGPLIERIEKAITNILTDYGTNRIQDSSVS